RQLSGALDLLQQAQVIATVDWQEGKNSIAQLHLYRGSRLAASGTPAQTLPLTDGEFADSLRVKELRNLKPPEWGIVTEFYRLLSGRDNIQPSKADLSTALGLVAEHGPVKAKALMPLVVAVLKEKWPDAKTFGAITRYVPDALAEYQRRERRMAW